MLRPFANQHDVKPFQTEMLPMSAGWMLQMFEPLNVAIDVADGLSNAKMTTTRIGR